MRPVFLAHQRSTETTYEDIDELELPGYVTPLPSEYEAGYEAPLSVQGVGDLESAQVLFSESLLESVRQHMQVRENWGVSNVSQHWAGPKCT